MVSSKSGNGVRKQRVDEIDEVDIFSRSRQRIAITAQNGGVVGTNRDDVDATRGRGARSVTRVVNGNLGVNHFTG
jgi:hypothetical protein